MLKTTLNFTSTHLTDKQIGMRVPTQYENENENKKMTTGAVIGLSLVTLTTLGGIYYFTKRGVGKTVNKYSFNELPQFFETRTNNPSILEGSSSTLSEKNTWNTVTTMYKGEKNNLSSSADSNILKTDVNKARKPKRTKNNWRKQRDNKIVPGIIRQISKDIKEYIKLCGIDKYNNKVNPAKLDEILTNAVGKENVIERPYLEDGKYGLGRVKEYKSPNGRIYVLESHNSSKGVITRLYMNCPDKHLRAYLHADGTFRLNSYTSDEAHFLTTAKGKRWMEESKFLKK